MGEVERTSSITPTLRLFLLASVTFLLYPFLCFWTVTGAIWFSNSNSCVTSLLYPLFHPLSSPPSPIPYLLSSILFPLSSVLEPLTSILHPLSSIVYRLLSILYPLNSIPYPLFSLFYPLYPLSPSLAPTSSIPTPKYFG